MSLWLADPVHAVAIADDVVFLDTAADAYLCLVDASAAMTLGRDGAVDIDNAATARTLLEAGLLRAVTPRRPLPDKPSLDLDPGRRGPQPRELLALAGACVSTAAAFRLKSFRRLLADVRRRKRTAAVDLEAVLEASAVFARMRPWSPVGGACLMRSHLQLTYLNALGLDADWVIGVRTWPFMAHCWLQAGPVALDDDVERLVPYTPILVI